MPVWNREQTLGQAIRSVGEQQYSNWELLLVDDGSTDGTLAVAEQHLQDRRIRLIRQTHQGVCAARNAALRQARGEIIAYLDSDNSWFPCYLAEPDFQDLCLIHLAEWLEKAERSPHWRLQPELYEQIARRLGGAPWATFERITRAVKTRASAKGGQRAAA